MFKKIKKYENETFNNDSCLLFTLNVCKNVGPLAGLGTFVPCK